MQSLLRPKYFYTSPSINNLRSLTYCWKCAAPITAQSLFCNQTSCNALQPFSLDKANIFQVFKLNDEFDIDSASLSLHYKDLQRLLHPDKFATRSEEERDYSASASSSINQAYDILKSPVRRAEYMIRNKFGIDIFDDDKSNQNIDFEGKNALMVRVFEIMECIEDMDGDQSKILELMESLQKSVDEFSIDFKDSIREGDRDKAIKAAMHLKYFHKMLDDLNGMANVD
eukprot:gene22973-31279_t